MSARPRVTLSSHARLVTLRGEPIPPPPGIPTTLHGTADHIEHEVCAVLLDDGREVLVAREKLTVLP